MKPSLLKRLIKAVAVIAGLMIAALLVAVWFSPYGKQKGFDYKLVEHTVTIGVSADSVFRFLGNSDNAARWSVFVDHISTLNANEVPDGRPGSVRRCFCRADETGQRWDERILEVEPLKRRRLITYNLVDFPLEASHVASEQRYEKLGTNRCRLTFTMFFLNHDPDLLTELKMYLGAYEAKDIFEKNMGNIKRILETGS